MRDWTQRALRCASVLTLVATLMALALTPVRSAPQPAYDGPLEHVVLDWNRHALEALVNAPAAEPPGAGQTPPVSALHLAMVHGAIYDAVNTIDGGYQPYLAGLPPAPASASLAAAVATAAHRVLVGVVVAPPLAPAIVARLNGLRAATLAAAVVADGQAAVDAGVAAGAAAAAAMLAARADDGRYVPFSHPIGADPGEWRPTPPGFVSDPFAWVARVEPFVLDSPSQVRTKGPRALTSGGYAKDYDEVKALGGLTGSGRTPAQEAVAQFYNVTPIELFNRTFRTIAVDEGLTLVAQARLFAMLNLAGADSAIGCWDDKAHWAFWRPITAIREGDADGNPRTAGDPEWTPLLATPPYPDHPSGYNCYTAAVMHTAKAFFGKDRLNFTVVRAPGAPGVTRAYKHFTDVIDDTIDARVYQGIHFRTADVQGAGLGKDVAHWLARHYFQRAK